LLSGCSGPPSHTDKRREGGPEQPDSKKIKSGLDIKSKRIKKKNRERSKERSKERSRAEGK